MLYGPFTVMSYSPAGELTDTPAAGVHYTADTGYLQTNSAVLSAYVVRPVHPLQFVLAGDDPANPQWTVALVFPDQSVADGVLAALA